MALLWLIQHSCSNLLQQAKQPHHLANCWLSLLFTSFSSASPPAQCSIVSVSILAASSIVPNVGGACSIFTWSSPLSTTFSFVDTADEKKEFEELTNFRMTPLHFCCSSSLPFFFFQKKAPLALTRFILVMLCLSAISSLMIIMTISSFSAKRFSIFLSQSRNSGRWGLTSRLANGVSYQLNPALGNWKDLSITELCWFKKWVKSASCKRANDGVRTVRRSHLHYFLGRGKCEWSLHIASNFFVAVAAYIQFCVKKNVPLLWFLPPRCCEILPTGLSVVNVTAISWVKFSSFGRHKTKNNWYTMFHYWVPSIATQRLHFLSKTCVH